MTKHFNNLTPAEDERLALLFEEMAEAIQIVGKIMRHGYESRHPEGVTLNRQLLENELGHVRFAMINLCEHGDLSKARIHAYADEKRVNVAKYLHHHQPMQAESENPS